MHLLIQHGTWVVVPIGFVLGFLYLAVFPRLFPSLLMRSLEREDALKASSPTTPAWTDAAPTARPAAFKTTVTIKSHP